MKNRTCKFNVETGASLGPNYFYRFIVFYYAQQRHKTSSNEGDAKEERDRLLCI